VSTNRGSLDSKSRTLNRDGPVAKKPAGTASNQCQPEFKFPIGGQADVSKSIRRFLARTLLRNVALEPKLKRYVTVRVDRFSKKIDGWLKPGAKWRSAAPSSGANIPSARAYFYDAGERSNVRLWHLADLSAQRSKRLLSGLKRTLQRHKPKALFISKISVRRVWSIRWDPRGPAPRGVGTGAAS